MSKIKKIIEREIQDLKEEEGPQYCGSEAYDLWAAGRNGRISILEDVIGEVEILMPYNLEQLSEVYGFHVTNQSRPENGVFLFQVPYIQAFSHGIRIEYSSIVGEENFYVHAGSSKASRIQQGEFDQYIESMENAMEIVLHLNRILEETKKTPSI